MLYIIKIISKDRFIKSYIKETLEEAREFSKNMMKNRGKDRKAEIYLRREDLVEVFTPGNPPEKLQQ